MFTGLITDIGKVKSRIGNKLTISSSENIKPGDSISVNGVCLTVAKKEPENFTVDLLDETKKRTNLCRLRIGEPVNLEQALKVGDRLGGHIVTGHVDCTGRVIRRYKNILEIKSPVRNLLPKGSIAVNGVSLTIVKVIRNRFTVHLIPYTLEHTNLGKARIVNIETDKYLHTQTRPNQRD